MDIAHKRRAARSSAMLFALAGVAFLVAAFLNDDASNLVLGTQVLGAVLFFVNAFLQHRRASRLP